MPDLVRSWRSDNVGKSHPRLGNGASANGTEPAGNRSPSSTTSTGAARPATSGRPTGRGCELAEILAAFAEEHQRHLEALDELEELRIDRPDSATIVVTAPSGQITTLGLNADGRLASVTDPLGQTVQLNCTRTDLLASVSDPNLGTSTFEYDADGRLTKDTNAGGGYQALDRTDHGAITQVLRISIPMRV